jgi:hypothetical protein
MVAFPLRLSFIMPRISYENMSYGGCGDTRFAGGGQDCAARALAGLRAPA